MAAIQRRPGSRTVLTASFLPTTDINWPSATAKPVFLHSSFRTSSTWLWERFRRLPETTAYYEIFHEMLADLEISHLMGNNYASWDSRHPAHAPYLIEFLNLIEGERGVKGFTSDMAFKSFLPIGGFDGDITIEEKTYVDFLIRHSRENHKIPVLSCTRSLGRTSALSRQYPGCHILIHRQLFDQWASYTSLSLKGDNYYFNVMNLVIDNSCDQFLSNISTCFPTTHVNIQDNNLFYRFIFFHLYLYAHAFDACEIVIDVAKCRNSDYQATMEQKIRQSTSLAVDLSGAKRNFEVSLLYIDDRASFIDTIRQFTKIICGTAPTTESADFVTALAEQLIEDWNHNDFHTRRMRSGYIEHLTSSFALGNERQLVIEAQSKAAAEGAARNALAEELSSVKAAFEMNSKHSAEMQARLSAELAIAMATVEKLSDELSHFRNEQETLASDNEELRRESKSLRAELDLIASELNASRQSHQEVLSRFDKQTSQLLHTYAELNVAKAEITKLNNLLKIAQQQPPTLMRRLARFKTRTLRRIIN